MKFTPFLSLGLGAVVLAAPRANSNSRRATNSACAGNSASDRSLWCDYNIDTDYESVIPNTGVTREYWLELTQVTISPDGVSRTAMAVNGSIPGPTIVADWGDDIVVHVTNSLTESHNGSSIHW
jgi:hypothetical protein